MTICFLTFYSTILRSDTRFYNRVPHSSPTRLLTTLPFSSAQIFRPYFLLSSSFCRRSLSAFFSYKNYSLAFIVYLIFMELPFQLENTAYDWLILGTGFEESMYAAYLSKTLRHKLLVLDVEHAYSNHQKTMNFKEFHAFANSKPNPLKKCIFEHLPPTNPTNELFATKINTSSDFKYFNLDAMPKLLYSTSPTVRFMQEADMDQYMDFRAIQAQYFYSNGKMMKTPTSKNQIFTSKDLSLLEKKHLFQLLHKLVQLHNHLTGYQANQNSTDEFDKDTQQLDENIVNLYNEQTNARNFLNKLVNNDKIVDIILFALAMCESYRVSTKSFLFRLCKFVRSIGVHSETAFLYTNHGTGDIPQGFCRIAAVYGSDYILHSNITIQPIQDLEKVETNLAKEPLKIKNGIILSHCFRNVLKEQQESASYSQLLRVTVITTKDLSKLDPEIREHFKEVEQEQVFKKPHGPLMYILSPNTIGANPVYILRVDNQANVTHSNYEAFFVQSLVEEGESAEEMRGRMVEFVRKMDREEGKEDVNYVCYEQAYVQRRDNTAGEFRREKNIFMCMDDVFEMDFDAQSENFERNVKELEGEFKGAEMAQKVEQAEEEDDVEKLLRKIEKLSK